MKRSDRNLTLGLGLLLALCLPIVGDGQVNNAACCNLASSFQSSIFQGGTGDEEFFAVPGGPPNVMILLDNSGSMLGELPNGLPPVASGTGTCSGTYLDAYVALRTSVPYDNGYTTNLLTDSPPWGLGTCSGNGCLFLGTSYYRYQAWTVNSATQYTSANACSGALPSVPSSGSGVTDCQNCLDSKGYYVWYVGGFGGGPRAAFKGDFLNGYPPKYVVARKVIKDLISIDDARPSPLDNMRFGLTIFNPNAGSGTCGSQTSSLQSCDG